MTRGRGPRARPGRRRAGGRDRWPRPTATRSSWARSCADCPSPGSLVFDEAAGRWSVDRSAGHRAARERARGDRAPRGAPRRGVAGGAAARGGDRPRVRPRAARRRCSRRTRASLLDHLEAAVAASLLAESSERVGQFRFAHALINQTLYEGLGATRRARMHQRVAQALEQLYGADPGEHLAELALHWRLAAVSVDKAKAADYALQSRAACAREPRPRRGGEAVRRRRRANAATSTAASVARR